MDPIFSMDDFGFDECAETFAQRKYEGGDGLCLLKAKNLPKEQFKNWVEKVRSLAKETVFYRFKENTATLYALGNIKKVQHVLLKLKPEIDQIYKNANPGGVDYPKITLDF